jgi:hypothetical protein
MPSLSSQDKTNITSYMIDVKLPDVLEESLRAKQANFSIQQTISAVSGIFAGIPGLQPFAAGGFLIGGGVSLLMSLFTAAEIDTIRGQANETYWLEVKRQLQCALPDSYTDTAWLRDRMARAVENVVPFNGRDIKLSTQANNVVAQAIRSFEPQAFDIILNNAKTCWQGDENGLRACDPACLPTLALVPHDVTDSPLGYSYQISANTWLIGSNQSGIFSWRAPYADQCYRIDGNTLVEPVGGGNTPFTYITVIKCDGTTEILYNLTDLSGKCFHEIDIASNTPFSLYLTISECSGQPATNHPAAIVRFGTNQQIALEGQTATVPVKLFSTNPLTSPVTVDVTLEGISTAIVDSDFTFQSPTQITFPAGSIPGASQNVSIPITSDAPIEDVERIVLRLANPTGGALIAEPSVHVVAVQDVPVTWCVRLDLVQSAYGEYLSGNVSHGPSGYAGTGTLRFELDAAYKITAWAAAWNGGSATASRINANGSIGASIAFNQNFDPPINARGWVAQLDGLTMTAIAVAGIGPKPPLPDCPN